MCEMKQIRNTCRVMRGSKIGVSGSKALKTKNGDKRGED